MAIVVNPTPITAPTSSEKDTIKTYTVDLMITATAGTFLAPDTIYEHIDTVPDLSPGATWPPFHTSNPFDDVNATMQLRTRNLSKSSTTSDGVCYVVLTLGYEQQVISLQANKNKSQPPPYEEQTPDNSDPTAWEAEVLFDQIEKEYTPPRMRFAGFYDATDPTFDPVIFPPALLQAVDNKSCVISKGAYAPIVNTACDPIVNPIQLVRYRQKITLIERVENLAGQIVSDEMRLSNFVNDRTLKLVKPKQQINWSFPAGTLMFSVVRPVIRRVTWTDVTDQERVYWEKRYEFEYDPQGHYWDIANQGNRKTPIAGEAKDETTGKILTGGQFAAVANGDLFPIDIADAVSKDNSPQMLTLGGRPDSHGVGVMRYERLRADFLNTDTTPGAPKLLASLSI